MMSGGRDILIVEDDAEVSFVFELALTDEGFQVDVAQNGKIALQHVATRLPDLILLDLQMPVMNGETFAREFRTRYGDATPIIIVSTVRNQPLASSITNARMLTKPVELDYLLDCIEQTLKWNPWPDQTTGHGFHA